MKCEHCGTLLTESDKFCNGCGARVEKNGDSSLENQSDVSNVLSTQSVTENQQGVLSVEEKKIPDKVMNHKENHTNRSNKKFVVIIVILVLALIAAVVFGVYYFLESRDSHSENKENEENQEVPDLPDLNSSVYFAGATFSIPDDANYSVSDSKLNIFMNDWYAVIQTNSYSYSVMYQLREEYANTLIGMGMPSEFVGEEQIRNTKYLIYEVEQNNQKMLLAIRDYTETSTLLIVLANLYGNDTTTTSLDDLEEILATAEFQSTDKNFGVDEDDVDMSKYFEAMDEFEVTG